jgi:hypothetical protein
MMFQAELDKYEHDAEISSLSHSLKQKFMPVMTTPAVQDAS